MPNLLQSTQSKNHQIILPQKEIHSTSINSSLKVMLNLRTKTHPPHPISTNFSLFFPLLCRNLLFNSTIMFYTHPPKKYTQSISFHSQHNKLKITPFFICSQFFRMITWWQHHQILWDHFLSTSIRLCF